MAQEDKLSVNKSEGTKNWQIWYRTASSGAFASFENVKEKTKTLIVTSECQTYLPYNRISNSKRNME